MKVDLIDFYAEDGILLNGFVANASSKKVVIATHGMSSNCFKEREKTIAEKCLENNIAFFSYNNRGSELIKYVTANKDGKTIKLLGGTTYENPIDGYYDIKGAISKALELGYDEIYLQGHSLGCTKTVYTYNKLKEENSELLKKIKGVILLSLVDIPKTLKIYLNENFNNMLKLAEEKELRDEIYDIMPKESFIHPISVKTFLKYAKYNQDINFARYSEESYNFDELNNIETPLFMRWGNLNEMIEQTADNLVDRLNQKILNKEKDINYIDGADHGYTNNYEVLAEEIVNFLNNIK